MLWKVPVQFSFAPASRGRSAASWRTMRSARRAISSAARREKVNSRMVPGSVPCAMRCATRCASVLVLPDPAPAITNSGAAASIASAVLYGIALCGVEACKISFCLSAWGVFDNEIHSFERYREDTCVVKILSSARYRTFVLLSIRPGIPSIQATSYAGVCEFPNPQQVLRPAPCTRHRHCVRC